MLNGTVGSLKKSLYESQVWKPNFERLINQKSGIYDIYGFIFSEVLKSTNFPNGKKQRRSRSLIFKAKSVKKIKINRAQQQR